MDKDFKNAINPTNNIRDGGIIKIEGWSMEE